MQRPLSQLLHSTFRVTSSDRRLITLHRQGDLLDGLKETGLAANPEGTVIGVQASKGVYLGHTVIGYTWFVGPLDRPSPVHFGDSMQELERFLWDEFDRQPDAKTPLPFLIGQEQGATMAIAMAGAAPDLLGGVIAIDPVFPVVPGWEPPLAPLEGLPILLVSSPAATVGGAGVLAGDDLVAEIERWGGTVSVIDESGDGGLTQTGQVADWLIRQPLRTRTS